VAILVIGVGAAGVFKASKEHTSETRDLRPYSALLEGTPFWPSQAIAQELAANPLHARYPLVLTIDGTRVAAGQWNYQAAFTLDGLVNSIQGDRPLTIAEGVYAGSPAWVISSAWGGQTPGGPWVDSLFLSKKDLRILHRIAYSRTGLPMVVQDFVDDSVIQTFSISKPPPRGARALPVNSSVPLLVDLSFDLSLLKVFVQALPLHRQWRGSLYLVVRVSYPGMVPQFLPVDLAVIGRERVNVPAGTFECWKLSVETAVKDLTLWVSTDKQWVVRMQSAIPDGVSHQVLTSSHTR
jgi:hypothetical protein